MNVYKFIGTWRETFVIFVYPKIFFRLARAIRHTIKNPKPEFYCRVREGLFFNCRL